VANAWHTAGFTGQNVKLAIVDMGFANLVTLKAQDEIPAAAIEVNYTASAMNAGSGSHGSACAETVYDMAPGVSMYLIKIDDPTDLIAVKDYCIAQGIKIVSFSIGWDALNFHDGVAYANWYSTVANHPVTAVDLAQASGIFWCTAAGNEQKQQSLIDWRDGGTTPDGALDWNSTNGNLNILWLNGSSTIPAGNWISIYMTWNQWPTTNQDFDLDLYCKPTGSTTWTRVASGSDTQSGTSTSYPYEDISYQTTQGGQYAVLVASYGTNTSPTFILRYYGVDEPNYFGYGNLSTPVPGSISIPGDAASAFTVGAINYANYPTGPIEYFSSLGPNNRAYTGGSAVIKPDICGPDMTASVTYGTSFGGTSAATPHISGLAALVKGAYPSYTLAQIKTFIESNGFDLGIAGKDNTFGSGAARLPSPPALPTVQWTSASQSGAENVGTMTVTAQLSAASGLPVTVPFTVSGSAANPADYTITTSPITIAAGATTGSATITVVNDTLYENNETVIVTMGTPTNATVGTTTVHTAIINIDATDIPSVQWTSASQSGAESVGTMTVTAQLSAVSELPVTVPFTVTGTATNPADYTITTSPITIAAGSTTGSATITVVNDTLYENNETVALTIGAPTNATLGATTVHTATINIDATDIPSVQWTSASQSGAESVGTMTVTAQLSAVSALPTTVPFTVTGTATNPADYTITASPITIAAGSTTGSATIIVVNDTLYENNETVIVTMGAPTNATLGATTVHTATINDDDNSPIQIWRQTYFGSIANSGEGADLNDFDKDGLVNLIEFGFGLNPKTNSSGLLPRPQRSGNNFVVSFTQPADVSGITYGAEWSQSLLAGNWNGVADTGVFPQHTFSVPIGTMTKLFMRLRVTNP
jgi:hypothetical protein